MIETFNGKTPKTAPSAYIHKTSTLIGNVTVGDNCSVWPGAVLRGDVAKIIIGPNSSVQDNAVIHVDLDVDTVIEEGVTIGHNATVHGTKVGHHCLIGMSACVMECSIGHESLIAAGTLLTAGKNIPPRSLVMGVPGKIIRQLSDDEVKNLYKSAQTYCTLSDMYKAELNK